MFPIIILAAVAAFIAYRLYLVLGSRTGHEQTFAAPTDAKAAAPKLIDAGAESRTIKPADAAVEGAAVPIIRAIAMAEPGFSASQFLDGARGAYQLILEAYWRDDENALADFVSPDVHASFVDAIAARRADGHRLDNRLVTIENATIIEAAIDGMDARLVVRFEADIATVTRDRDGQVIAGSLSDAVPTSDIWTFARTLKSRDPSWVLVETDESA